MVSSEDYPNNHYMVENGDSFTKEKTREVEEEAREQALKQAQLWTKQQSQNKTETNRQRRRCQQFSHAV
jgi:hypothetical protein